MSYEETVTAAKLAARDVLRTKQVEKRLEKIRSLNISIKNVDKDIASTNEDTQIAIVEANALPDAHPRKASRVEAANKLKESNDKHITEVLEKDKAELVKEVTEVTAEIAEIEAGKKKVDFEPMTELANEFIKERFQEAYVAGEYDVDAKKAKKEGDK